jgi:TM2 domain-containing membrane protein YozV
MYKVMGVDGRPYGPVNVEQLRQWIGEGRVNAQTSIQPEGAAEWKALANFPELMTPAVPPVVPVFAPPKPPGADKKIAAGLCGILLGHFGVHKFILGYTIEGITMLLVTLLTCGVGGVVMWIIGLIEGITYLTKSDAEFVATYIQNKKGWF